MSFEWIGLLTLAVGGLCLALGSRFSTYAFLLATLLGASAATILTALGGANLQPAQALLCFLVIVACGKEHRARLFGAIAYPGPGFWLLLTTIYAIVSAIFLPRIFEGLSQVFTFARTDAGPGLLLTPLRPVSGNLTQTLYFVGDFLCFCVFCAFAADPRGARTAANAVIVCGIVNVGFAALDYATYFTGTAEWLGFMRNASYRMLDNAEVVGLKRLVGSFPEASAFASATLALFAFTLTLWLNDFPSRLAGAVTALLLAALILSTSTTAYASLAIYIALVYAATAGRLLLGQVTMRRLAFVALTPIAALFLAGATSLDHGASTVVAELFDRLILTKGNTDSALERSTWNTQALVNFFDTYGLGAGVGSARASSVVIAVLANIGVLGACAYGIFMASCLAAPFREADGPTRAARLAAGSACIALFIAGCVSGTTIDLGISFFVFAAIAAAPIAARGRSPARRGARPGAAAPSLAV